MSNINRNDTKHFVIREFMGSIVPQYSFLSVKENSKQLFSLIKSRSFLYLDCSSRADPELGIIKRFITKTPEDYKQNFSEKKDLAF